MRATMPASIGSESYDTISGFGALHFCRIRIVRLTQSLGTCYVSDPIRGRDGRTKFIIRYRERTADQRWKQKSETIYCESKKAARAQLMERICEKANRPAVTSETTFSRFIESVWWPNLDRKDIKPSTRQSYESALNNHLLELFGEMNLADIAPLHIEEMLTKRRLSGLSNKSLRNLLVLLSSMFALAVDNDLIPRSPVRSRHRMPVRRTEKPIWQPAQVRLIIDHAPAEDRLLFATAAMTGARLGELLALQRKHINLEEKTLRIEQSLWNGKLVPPKTPGSVRLIALAPTLAALMRRHLMENTAGPEAFVFSKADGSTLNPDVLRKDVLYPILDRLGIARGTRVSGFHCFRHSAGSFVNSQTGNLKLAQKLLPSSKTTCSVIYRSDTAGGIQHRPDETYPFAWTCAHHTTPFYAPAKPSNASRTMASIDRTSSSVSFAN